MFMANLFCLLVHNGEERSSGHRAIGSSLRLRTKAPVLTTCSTIVWNPSHPAEGISIGVRSPTS